MINIQVYELRIAMETSEESLFCIRSCDTHSNINEFISVTRYLME